MVYKIALASSDGKVVNEHFGHCKRFCILKIHNDKWELEGVREVIPACNGDEHSENALLNVIEKIKDCKYVIVSQIGFGAEQILKEHKIEVIVYKGWIDEFLKIL